MSKFAKFMKANKVEKKNEFYAATASLCDENGKPLEWEFKHISSKDNERIRDECTSEVAIPGKRNAFRPKLKMGLYFQKMIVASVVSPDLYDSELQDSYGVKDPEELLLAMVDGPGEYSDLVAFVQKMQGFDVQFDDKVEEAKN